MTTCDGERFLTRQLESIAAQSVLPTAMIVGDDASSDRSPAIVAGFARRMPFPVTLLRARNRIGLHANSDRVLACAAQVGDVIVPVDHDDVWARDKLAAVTEAFIEDDVALWFSDGTLIDAEDRPMGTRLWDIVGLDDGALSQIGTADGVRRLLHAATITGGTAAIRASVVPHVLPTPELLIDGSPVFWQDAWMVLIARLLGAVVVDPRPLLGYRRHAGQLSHDGDRVTTEAPRSRSAALRRDRWAVALTAARIRRDSSAGWLAGDCDLILDLDRFLAARSVASGQPRRRRGILAELRRGAYRRYARGVRTALYDLAMPGRPPDVAPSGSGSWIG